MFSDAQQDLRVLRAPGIWHFTRLEAQTLPSRSKTHFRLGKLKESFKLFYGLNIWSILHFPHDKIEEKYRLRNKKEVQILLVWKKKKHLANFQVNHSPSFHTDAQIDKDVKEELLTDTFNILNLQQCDKKKVMEEDKKRIRERLFQGINGKDWK